MRKHEIITSAGVVHVRFSDRSDGSFSLTEPSEVLEARRSLLIGSDQAPPWVAVRQVHGSVVHLAAAPSDSDESAIPEADAVVSFSPGVCVSVLTADCAPLVLVGSTGIAVVHAGWRGAVDGVVDAAAHELRVGGATPVAAVLGPCIQPAAYEFGVADLEPVVASFGPDVVGKTSDGAPALDLSRAVQISCEKAGWPAPERPQCTSSDSYFSYRTRADTGRQAAVAWISGAGAP